MSAGVEATEAQIQAEEAALIGTVSAEDGELTAAQIDRGFFLLALTSFVFYIGFQIVQAIQPNFFRDVLGMNGAQNGYLIAIRELPGFLLIFVAAFLLKLGLSRATSISLLIMGIGYCLFAFAGSFWQLIIPTLIASIGFHSWLQLQPALGLSLTRRGNEGTLLGRINGIGFLGSLIGLVGVFALLTWIERTKGPLEEYQEPYLRGLFFVCLAGCSARSSSSSSPYRRTTRQRLRLRHASSGARSTTSITRSHSWMAAVNRSISRSRPLCWWRNSGSMRAP
ncbi:MAG: hypothetical protein R2848_18290 [Thermomicrobiales bacterium]